jgi:tetratricopeptide (TPR) repeat protein
LNPLRFLLFCFLLPNAPGLQAGAGPAFVGSSACAECHAEAYAAWQGSHHELAMQPASADTVLGDFNDATFRYNGVTTTFYTREGRYFVRTDGETGELTEFPVEFVFGVYPLQQYLLPLPGGRLQALSIALDARPADAGGQRWYHLYPDEQVDHNDPLHWTGHYQNWNSNCGECHTTGYDKNFAADTGRFTTRYSAGNVGCEACHGPGEQHLALASAGSLGPGRPHGFATELAQRGQWAFPEGDAIARRSAPLSGDQQIDSCGRCHSRRGNLGEYHYGRDLLDSHRLALPAPPLYYPDGQIRDEVYVYGSFVQSRMHQAGVVCSNCHEPHSLQLRASDNGVCAQCHKADVYDRAEHHHHPAGSAGALCANCHMPETTYMGVDPRRDHSMRIPRPDLSVVIGTPNACTACHEEQDAQWALQALQAWGVRFTDTASHPARTFDQADRGDARAVPGLAQLAQDRTQPPIWRATAMEALGGFGGAAAWDSVHGLLAAEDPLLRASAVRALDFVPLLQRYQLLRKKLNDEVTTVRMEIARSLAAVPLEQLTPDQAAELRALFDEYVRIQRMNADSPGVQLQLGIFLLNRGDLPAAEAAYRRALAANPQLVAARINLADLLRRQGRDDEARSLLLETLVFTPDNGPALHSLGLLETRAGNRKAALDYLGRAAALETRGTRHRYVYAIALHDSGRPTDAIGELRAALREAPRDENILTALCNYLAEQGLQEQALAHARTLLQIAPENRGYQQLYRQLGGR